MRIAHLGFLIPPDRAHLVIAPEGGGGPDYDQVTANRDGTAGWKPRWAKNGI